jgi:cysteine desulfurase
MSIKGVARFYKQKRHIITCKTEHKCVLDSCRVLQEEGFDVTYLDVNQDGLIDLQVGFTISICMRAVRVPWVI